MAAFQGDAVMFHAGTREVLFWLSKMDQKKKNLFLKHVSMFTGMFFKVREAEKIIMQTKYPFTDRYAG